MSERKRLALLAAFGGAAFALGAAVVAARLARPERARVALREQPLAADAPGGGITTRQAADVTLPSAELERMWSPEYLERLARTYWRFLEHISLGVLRVVYSPDSREVVAFGRPLVLLRFRAPEYDLAPDRGAVTWRIDRGLLVIPRGRGKGVLRLSVERLRSPPPALPAPPPGETTITVRSEVVNFYPMLAGSGALAAIGGVFYRNTQLRIHIVVTNAFLRSLARLELAPSVVGQLRAA